MPIALVRLIHRHRRVAEHGLGPSRGHGDEFVDSNHRIANLVQLARNLLMLDLKIGNRRLASRTPVHDVLPAIDQPFLVQPDKHLAHRPRQVLVHGEVFPVPVHRHPQPLHLVENRAAVLALPLPHPLDEPLAPQVTPPLAFLGELALDHHLSGDSGVIGSGQPKREKTPHPMPAHDDVHLRLVEHVSHVQAACNVGRRQQQREHRPRFSGRRGGDGEEPFLDPVLGAARFNRARLVRFG